jgi:hypothetical protein
MNRRTFGGLSGTVFFAGLVLALIINPFNLPIFFIGIGASIFIGALASPNPNALYGAMFGTLWMLVLAVFFLSGATFWQVFLIGGVLSALLGTFGRPIIASLTGSNLYGAYNSNNRPPGGSYQPQQPYYQPPQQPNQQSYQPYQQGYQPPAPGEAYQEGNQQYRYPSQGQEYEQPQPQYPPQEMPPQ